MDWTVLACTYQSAVLLIPTAPHYTLSDLQPKDTTGLSKSTAARHHAARRSRPPTGGSSPQRTRCEPATYRSLLIALSCYDSSASASSHSLPTRKCSMPPGTHRTVQACERYELDTCRLVPCYVHTDPHLSHWVARRNQVVLLQTDPAPVNSCRYIFQSE